MSVAAVRPAIRDQCDAQEFRRLMSHWPTGVTVITSWDMGSPVGCTVNSMMSVSLLPPLLAVALADGSNTLEAICRTGAFGLSVLGADQHEISHRFAHCSQTDRFSRLRYRWQNRLPLLADAVAAAICTVWDTVVCGDHVMVVGAPVWYTAREDGSPLLFHRRRYHQLARVPADQADGK